MHEPLEITRTVTGRAQVVLGADNTPACPPSARSVDGWLERFGLELVEVVDGIDTFLWIARRGTATFCLSCDDWTGELTIMAWDDTPDSALEDLVRRATGE